MTKSFKIDKWTTVQGKCKDGVHTLSFSSTIQSTRFFFAPKHVNGSRKTCVAEKNLMLNDGTKNRSDLIPTEFEEQHKQKNKYSRIENE